MVTHKGYSQEFIDQVRNASNIVDIAKSYFPLKQKGQDFWTCCPFHTEKTPSFAINNAKQFYHCFGCGESGNVFNLVMKMENLPWYEAVAFLAKKANIEIPQNEDNKAWLQQRYQKEKMHEALMLARDFYCRNLYLSKNKAALDYLHQRGIDDDLIKLFHIGYSDNWQGVVDELKKHGISERLMKDAGIVGTGENGRIWDAQYERVTFAIHDVYGNCIGFTGRTMKSDDNLAKYKNTADTLVFNKSNIVYGIDVMKQKSRGKHFDGLIVVEGNVDEIAMVKHGFVNTVACMGTALTKFHANILARFGKIVYLCLDGDSAGQKATLKSIAVLQEAGLTVKIITLPNKQDPDEFLQTHDAAAMQQMINNSVGALEFKLEYVKQNCDLTNKMGKTEYINKVVEILSVIDNAAERELYLPDIAQTVGVAVEAIRNTVNSRLVTKTPEIVKKQQNTIYSGNYANNNHNIQIKGVAPKIIKAEEIVTKAILMGYDYAQNIDLETLPEFHNQIYWQIITLGLKPDDIYDKLDAKDVPKELLEGNNHNLSLQERIREFRDCIYTLQDNKLEQAFQQAKKDGDLVKVSSIKEQREKLKQQHAKKVEEV